MRLPIPTNPEGWWIPLAILYGIAAIYYLFLRHINFRIKKEELHEN